MNFVFIASQFTSQEAMNLANLLMNFIKVQQELQEASSLKARDQILHRARRLAAELKAPPWNISIDMLSDICDSLADWQYQISNWMAKNYP